MVRQRITRKELREPDPFMAKSAAAFEWAKAHLHHMVYGVLSILVVMALIVGWSSWQTKRQQTAETLLYEALKGQPTPEELADADRARTMEPLQAIVRDYGKTPAGTMAYWHLGHLLFAHKQYAEALEAYEQVQRLLPGSGQPLSAALVTLNVGYAYEATGACEQAIIRYQAVLDGSTPWLFGEAFLGMGRCHEQRGDTTQAVKVYEQALESPHVAEGTRQQITERFDRLQAETTPKTSAPPKPTP